MPCGNGTVPVINTTIWLMLSASWMVVKNWVSPTCSKLWTCNGGKATFKIKFLTYIKLHIRYWNIFSHMMLSTSTNNIMAQIMLSQSTNNLNSSHHLNPIHTSTLTFSNIQFNIIIPLMTLNYLLVFWHNHLGCLNFPPTCMSYVILSMFKLWQKNLANCHISFGHFVHSCQQKSIGLKFSKSQTGSDMRYSCHHNSSRFTFPIFAHSCHFSVLHSLQSITHRVYINRRRQYICLIWN